MRVLLTADTLGGVWTYTVELTRALREIDFIVATMGDLPSGAQLDDLPPNTTVVSSTFRLEWMDAPWDDVANAGYWLLDLEATHAPDIVHLNGYTHAALRFESPKLVVAHSDVLSWWRAVKEEDAPAEAWDRYRVNVQHGLQSAALVVAPSAAMLGTLDQHYRYQTPGRVIHNGRQTVSHAPAGGRHTVFAAGRLWDEAKNLGAVVAAAPRIGWPVHVAGHGGAASDNVVYHGRLDATGMQRQYAETGIYLFPALYEPFGLSILEAAISGCALVLGDIASLREIWSDAALYVPPCDPAAIAESVNALIHEPAARAEMARRAVERASRYTSEAMGRAYRDVYERLVSEARPPAGATRQGAEAGR